MTAPLPTSIYGINPTSAFNIVVPSQHPFVGAGIAAKHTYNNRHTPNIHPVQHYPQIVVPRSSAEGRVTVAGGVLGSTISPGQGTNHNAATTLGINKQIADAR